MPEQKESFTFKIPEGWEKSKNWVYISLVLLIVIIILGVYIRTVNIPNLKDITTGDYTLGPDLDPFLYLRLAGYIIENGSLPFPDEARYLGLGFFYKNLMSFYVAYFYKFLSLFSDKITLEYAAIIFPVAAFGLSIIVFFFFVREVFHGRSEFEKNSIAVLSSLLYSVVPQMQHRTAAGIPELESAGLVFFWLSFFLFLRAWNSDGKNFLGVNRRYFFGFLAGLSTSMMVYTWGGFRFIFLSIALATMVAFFLGKVKKEESIVYGLWFLPSYLTLISWQGLSATVFDITTSVPAFFVLVLVFANVLFGKFLGIKARSIIKRDWFSDEISCFFAVVLLGFLALLLIKPGFALGLFGDFLGRLIHPYGSGRVGLTVAENLEPYTSDLINSQFGKPFFWMMFFGVIMIFYDTIRHFNKKHKAILLSSFLLFMTAFIFFRYSPNSLFNGVNFASQLFYFGSIVIFLLSAMYVYIKNSKNDEKSGELANINYNCLFLLSLTFFMILASKAAIRLIFISTPVFTVSVAFLPVIFISYWIKTKDDLWKVLLLIFILVSAFFFVKTFISYEKTTLYSTYGTVPSQYTIQWQKAMSWVRAETPENSVFVHWWDYGYWVQTIGQRPTVTDGGHLIGYWDHLTGRYLLTTPYPETALSIMKTYGVSYLLIDSTDLGKYPAYSTIGSDETNGDRASQVILTVVNPSQTQETQNETIRVYQGLGPVDEDIIYGEENQKVFLPKGKAVFAGMIIKSSLNQDGISFLQPTGIFVYNNRQVNIPVRYLYYGEQVNDFGGGLDAIIQIIPKMDQNNQQINLDNLGAAIYLSPKVSKSLFAQIYLLGDPFNKYPTVKLTHSENDPLIESLNSQGANIRDFVFFNGFRGPIKIWKVDYPSNILERGEFLETDGGYAELDGLQFTR